MLNKNLENPANLIGKIMLIGMALFVAIGFFGKCFDKNGAIGEWVTGSVGIAISLATLFLLYYTYMAQKQELDATKAQLKIQNTIAEQQKFETTFFNLLSLFRKNAEEQRAMFVDLKANISGWQKPAFDWNSVISRYNEYTVNYRVSLEAHFRTLIFTLDFIQNGRGLDEDYKKIFYNLIETYMTEEELYVTFFECYSKGEHSSLVKLIRDTELLHSFLNYQQGDIPTQIRDHFVLNK